MAQCGDFHRTVGGEDVIVEVDVDPGQRVQELDGPEGTDQASDIDVFGCGLGPQHPEDQVCTHAMLKGMVLVADKVDAAVLEDHAALTATPIKPSDGFAINRPTHCLTVAETRSKEVGWRSRAWGGGRSSGIRASFRLAADGAELAL